MIVYAESSAVLASALMARSAAPGLRILTLDQRVRENAERLGLQPLP